MSDDQGPKKGLRPRAAVTLLERALDYARRGWAVVPMHKPLDGGERCTCGRADCKNKGKHPWTTHGVKDATTDEAQIRRWWRAGGEPENNIGIATGAVSGILVLDVDAKSGGFESLAQLQARGIEIPRTAEAQTGGGGRHYVFAHPGVPVKSRTNIMPGLDIRADGAAIVAAPSLHKSGRRYLWVPGREPGEVELAPTPDWLLTLANQRETKTKPSKRAGDDGAADASVNITEGGRNDTLARIAGALRAKGLSEKDIVTILLAENRDRCRPPLDEAEVRQIAASIAKYAPTGPRGFEENFTVENGCLCLVAQTRDGPRKSVLVNLTAEIVDDVVWDDGEEEIHEYWIDGRDSNGTPLKRVRVLASDYPSMTWLAANWGSKAQWMAGNGAKDNLRLGIQVMSKRTNHRYVYKHSGWRNIEGHWFYLHAGGAIGADGVLGDITVELEENLRHIRLPSPPARGARELRDAIRASLDLLDIAPDPKVGAVVLSHAYRAMLAEVLPVTYTVWIEGLTGAFKSELAILAQAHYGEGFTNRTIPSSWIDTANAIERRSFFAKDAVFLVDDYVPRGSPSDIARLKAQVSHFIHYSVGNQTGRGRMNADGTQRRTYKPRGAVVSTGEDVPDGSSLRARMLVLSLAPARGDRSGTIAKDRLTVAQSDARAGKYALAMSGYARWLAPRLDAYRPRFHERVVELRDQLGRALAAQNQRAAHARTLDAAASAYAAWETFLEYANDEGAVTPEEKVQIAKRVWTALAGVIETQESTANEGPAEKGVALIRAAIQAGRAHIAGHDSRPPSHALSLGWKLAQTDPTEHAAGRETWTAPGECVGWIPKDNTEVVYVFPDVAWKVMRDFGRTRNDVHWSDATLWKRVAEAGMLAERDEARGRLTVRRRRDGRMHVVYALRASVFFEQDPSFGNVDTRDDQGGDDGDAPRASAIRWSTTTPQPPASSTPDVSRVDLSDARIGAPSEAVEAVDAETMLSLVYELERKAGVALPDDISPLAESHGIPRERVGPLLNLMVNAGTLQRVGAAFKLTEAAL